MNASPLLSATEIGEFIRYDSCERRFRLGFNKRELARRLPFAERLFNLLDPVLQRVGHELFTMNTSGQSVTAYAPGQEALERLSQELSQNIGEQDKVRGTDAG